MATEVVRADALTAGQRITINGQVLTVESVTIVGWDLVTPDEDGPFALVYVEGADPVPLFRDARITVPVDA